MPTKIQSIQCMHIEEACRRKGWRDLMISSVEQFQGKEKKIIIASTVRSKSDNIGFLNNFRVNTKHFVRFPKFRFSLKIFFSPISD